MGLDRTQEMLEEPDLQRDGVGGVWERLNRPLNQRKEGVGGGCMGDTECQTEKYRYCGQRMKEKAGRERRGGREGDGERTEPSSTLAAGGFISCFKDNSSPAVRSYGTVFPKHRE